MSYRVPVISACIGLGIMAIFILYRYNPATTWFYPVCPFKKLTGYNCPGCGTARALHCLLNGHIFRAVDHNLLIIPALIVIPAGLVASVTGKTNLVWRYANRPVWIAVILTFFWVLRNLPWGVFLWLNADI